MIAYEHTEAQAELDFMHNTAYRTDGLRWARNEIESLREQLAASQKREVMLRDALLELDQLLPACRLECASLREQLAARDKQIVLLREAIDRQPYTMDKQVCEALAAK